MKVPETTDSSTFVEATQFNLTTGKSERKSQFNFKFDIFLLYTVFKEHKGKIHTDCCLKNYTTGSNCEDFFQLIE